MSKKEDRDLSGLARHMRKNMTREEKHLWYDFLKTSPYTDNRQRQFGDYIVDFFCADARLVIELDGSQHYSEAGAGRDEKRDEYLRGLGFEVLRFSNYDVNTNFEGVCLMIKRRIDARKW